MTEIFDNIKKIYTFRNPCEELADQIEFFSESSVVATKTHMGNSRFSVKMFPSWTPTFWINLGPAYELSIGERRHFVTPGSGIVLTRDEIVERYNLPTDYLFTVKFYPGGLEAVLGINQSLMAGQLIELERVLPRCLIAQLKSAKNFEERVKKLEIYFISQMKHGKAKECYLRLIRDTIAVYSASGLQYNLNELSERLFTTSKTINRYFNRVVGTSPKSFFSTLRARAALTAYIGSEKAFDPGDFGYCDMSHFYKDVLKFTGRTMTEQRC